MPLARPSLRPAAVVALVAAVLACLLAAAPAHGDVPDRVETVIQDDAIFLHESEEGIRAALLQVKELGIDRVRLTAGWSVIAPQPDAAEMPEGFDATDPAAYPHAAWDNLDRAVRLVHEAGLEPMVDIAFWAPLWATKDRAPSPRNRTEVDPQRFADFARAVARRYSGTYATPEALAAVAAKAVDTGSVALAKLLGGRRAAAATQPAGDPEELPAVDLFTIWNEPNHPGFLQPQWVKRGGRWEPRSAELYRDMVFAAYPAIKDAAPAAQVLIGGTASMGSSTPGRSGVPPLRFLRALACVDEQLKPVRTGSCAGFRTIPGDGWAHHPYSLRTRPDVDAADQDKLPVAATSRLARTLRTLVARGRLAPGNAALYQTEYGYETREPDPRAVFSAAEQASLLALAERLGTADGAVRMWPQFLLKDRPGDLPGANNRPFGDWQTGLLLADGTPKPAFSAFKVPAAARCVGRGARREVEVWGRVRGVEAAPQARVELLSGKRWKAVGRAASTPREVRSDETVKRLRMGPGRVRLRWDSGPTAVVRVPDCGGKGTGRG